MRTAARRGLPPKATLTSERMLCLTESTRAQFMGQESATSTTVGAIRKEARAMAAEFESYKDWRLQADNNKTIADSAEGYSSKAGAEGKSRTSNVSPQLLQ
jgi:hypothetical protein